MNMKSKSVLATLLLVGSASAMNQGSGQGDRDYSSYAGDGSQTADLKATIESMERRHMGEMQTLTGQQAAQIEQLSQLFAETKAALAETKAALVRSNRTIDELTAQREKDREELNRKHEQEIRALQKQNEANVLKFEQAKEAEAARVARNNERMKKLSQLEKERNDWAGYIDGTKTVREDWEYGFHNPILRNSSQVSAFKQKQKMCTVPYCKVQA